MSRLLKNMKWGSQLVLGLLATCMVSLSTGQMVLAEDSQSTEAVVRTGGTQRIDTDHLVWTPVSETNPLGGADDFNAILFDSLVDFHETGGPIAAGRVENVNIVTFSEGQQGGINQFYDYLIPKFNVGLIAQNGITNKRTKIHNGDVAVQEVQYLTTTENHAGHSFVRQAQIDIFMNRARADLVALNERLWQLSANGIVDQDQWGQMQLTADKEWNVFEIDANSHKALNIMDTKANSTIIIKVTGNQINFNAMSVNNQMINQENINKIANRVLWVFNPNETNVAFQNTNLTGSVLASKANIRFTGGYSAINGTLIANQLSGEGSSSELHYVGYYIGKLEKDQTDSVEPSTTEPTSESSTPESSTPESEANSSSSTSSSSSSDASDSTSRSSTSESSISEPDSNTLESSTSESTQSSEKPITDLTSDSSTSDAVSDSSTTTATIESSTSESNAVTETSDSSKPGKLPQTGGSTMNSSKKPVKSQQVANTKTSTSNHSKRLPQTGEGDDWIEQTLSIIGLGTVLATGYLAIHLYRKK